MIVRDEEDFLETCLRSVFSVVDEIVLVDTGSEDSTLHIAKKYGARIFRIDWNDDFSEARNYSLERATGDWILVLDADESISPRAAPKLRDLAASGEADGYLLTYRSYSQTSNDVRWIPNDGSYEEGTGWDGWISAQVVRLFRNDPRIRFTGAVHESVDPSIASLGGKLAPTDIIIHHFHEKKGKSRLREKQISYLRMCEKNLAVCPDNAKTHFDMGLIHRHVLKDPERAIPHFKRALAVDPCHDDARLELALSYHVSGDAKAAAEEITRLLERNPACAPALVLCGIMLERRGKADQAIEAYERALRLNPNLVDARLALGTIWLRKGNAARTRSEWEAAYRVNPSNERLLLNLGALELREGNHEAAASLLEEVVKSSPENVSVWNNLGVLFAQTGRVRKAIEAFEKALVLDPSRDDVRRNLEGLRHSHTACTTQGQA